MSRTAKDLKTTRYHLKGIELQPGKSSHAISVKLIVDGVETHTLPTIGKRQPLSWDNLWLPCDLHTSSQLTVQVTEIHTLKDVVGLATCSASEMKKHVLSIDCENSQFTVKLTFLTEADAGRAYSEAFANVKQMEKTQGVLEKAGKIGTAFKTFLSLGSMMADLDPTGGAKVAFAVCTKAIEHLEQQEKQDAELNELIENLARMTPSVESVKSIANTNLEETVTAMLNLIEDASLFVLRYKSRNPWMRTLGSAIDSTSQDQIQALIAKFRKLREEFDTRVIVQTLDSVQMADMRSKLNGLKPVVAGYDPTRACLPGTRVTAIEDITAWALEPGTNPSLAWVHGLAGLGKSSIAASVCQALDQQGVLAASFFCKRDNPELRDPRRVLTNIVYGLALRLQPYQDEVVTAIRADPELLTRHIQPLYDALVTKPLQKITAENWPVGIIVVLVDALDECGDVESRKQLLTCLRGMSQTVAWLKIIVTSRPDPDLQDFFKRSSKNWFIDYNVLNYDALVDIRVFIQSQLGGIAEVENWPHDGVERLTHRSSGLFIWARTTCKFISDGYDACKRLEQVLAGKSLTDPIAELDALYTTTIKAGALDGDNYNLMVVLKCLGAIIVTATRTPLPVVDLAKLMRMRISLHALTRVVQNLGSVLYLDQKQNGAIRVCHPSFMDYLISPSRSKELCVSLDQQNTILGECCLETMKRELKFNICKLETSSLLNSQVPDLEARAKAAIPPHLNYSCLYWLSHLVKAKTGSLKRPLGEFLFDPALIYWLEALSLLGKLNIAPPSLLGVTHCVADTMQDYRTYSHDMYRFVLYFYDTISKSTPHLYVSALAFAPAKSEVAERAKSFFPNLLSITQGASKTWTPCLFSIWVSSGATSIALSPDGRRIVSGSEDSIVRIWDAQTGEPVLEPLQGHSREVSSVAFSPDGRRIVSGSNDNTVRIWDAETGDPVLQPLQGHSDWVRSVAFSPDGRRIVSGSNDRTVRTWDAETGNPVLEPFQGHSREVSSVAFSPDGRRIVSGSSDNTVRIWDVETGDPVLQPLQGHSDWVRSVTFSPDGQRIVSGSDDSTVRIWDAETGNPVLEPFQGHSREVSSVAFSPDGRRIVSGSSDNTVRIWDAETGDPVLQPLQGHSDWVQSVAFSPDGRRIVSGSNDRTVRTWDAETGNPVLEPLQGHSDSVISVVLSPDGRRIVSGSGDKTVRIQDVETGDLVLQPLRGHSSSVFSVTYSLDGRRIVSGSSDNTVRIWDAQTGEPLLEPFQGHSDSVNCVAFSPDGRHIVSGSNDSTVRIWDAQTGEPVLEPLQGHSDWVRSVTFSPDGRRIVSGSDDSTVRIWDAETGEPLLEPFQGHSDWVRSVAFSPDGRRIVSGSNDRTVRIWDAETGNPALEPFQGHSYSVLSVAFSPDGRRIVSGSGDNTVRIWDVETGDPVLEPLQGHSFAVNSVAFSPDGRRIVSGSTDYTVRIWDAEPYAVEHSSARQYVPGTKIPLLLRHEGSGLLSTSSQLARHMNTDGWVTTPEGGLFLCLPSEFRRPDDSLICIPSTSSRQQMVIDFSKFVHGTSWHLVAGA